MREIPWYLHKYCCDKVFHIVSSFKSLHYMCVLGGVLTSLKRPTCRKRYILSFIHLLKKWMLRKPNNINRSKPKINHVYASQNLMPHLNCTIMLEDFSSSFKWIIGFFVNVFFYTLLKHIYIDVITFKPSSHTFRRLLWGHANKYIIWTWFKCHWLHNISKC